MPGVGIRPSPSLVGFVTRRRAYSSIITIIIIIIKKKIIVRQLYIVGLINPSILKVKPNLIHHLFADRDGGYVRPCGNSALKNDPSGVVVG